MADRSIHVPTARSQAPELHSLSFKQPRHSWLASSQTGPESGQLALTLQLTHVPPTQKDVAPLQSSSPSHTPDVPVHAFSTQAPSSHGIGLLAPICAHSAAVTQHAFASSS